MQLSAGRQQGSFHAAQIAVPGISGKAVLASSCLGIFGGVAGSLNRNGRIESLVRCLLFPQSQPGKLATGESRTTACRVQRLPTLGGFGGVCCAAQTLRAQLQGPPVNPLRVAKTQASMRA